VVRRLLLASSLHRVGRKLAVCAVALPVAARAADEPQLPNELAITDSIVMTDRDELYASPAVEFFRLPDQKRLTLGSEFAYGLTDRLQVATEIPYVFVDPDDGKNVNGIGDMSAKARFALVNYRDHPFGLDVGFGLDFPTGDQHHDVGEGRASSDLSFTASAWLGPVDAQANAGWRRALEGGNGPEDEAEYNVALLYPIGEWFLVLEGNGESNRDSTKYYVTPEVIWRPTDHLELRLAAPCPVTHDAGDYGVIAGFTIEFEHVLGLTPHG
jgi:outer membrane putative beta-barrel porin/alpha-amylase